MTHLLFLKFITGLLQKFRDSAGGSQGRPDGVANSYSDQVAHALNKIIKANATHTSDECPICLEHSPIADSCITNCAHIFCRKCLVGVLKDNRSSSTKNRIPDGNCPVCQAKVESSKIIVLAKSKDGGYKSSFLVEQKVQPSSSVPVATNFQSNDAARRVLENSLNGAKSSKLDAVIRELFQIWDLDPGSKVLIFSQFLGFLDLMETSLRQRDIPFGRLDGKMTLKQRIAALELFKSGSQDRLHNQSSEEHRKGSVMLASMKAAGVGLNLVAASTVFIVDPWWNQSIEDQCINRVLRIGQKAETVRVRKFVVEDSVETQIVALQKKKKQMASEVYSDIRTDGTMSDTRPTIDDFKLMFGNLK